jgi:hypothetical protein
MERENGKKQPKREEKTLQAGFPLRQARRKRKEVREMFRHNGGHRVGSGIYWNAENGSMVHVKEERVLPGEERTIYYRIPFLLLFPLGMVLGGFYVFALPLIGIVNTVSVVGQRVFGGVLSQMRKSISFGWRPTEAYLAGKNKKEKKGEKDLE